MTIRNTSYSAGLLWIVATAALWSFLGLIGKFCLAQGMPPLQCAFWRCVFGGTAFFLHCAFAGSLRIPARHCGDSAACCRYYRHLAVLPVLVMRIIPNHRARNQARRQKW